MGNPISAWYNTEHIYLQQSYDASKEIGRELNMDGTALQGAA
jgi:hypothetical protein